MAELPLVDQEIVMLRALVRGMQGCFSSGQQVEQFGSRMNDILGMSYHSHTLTGLMPHQMTLQNMAMKLGAHIDELERVAKIGMIQDTKIADEIGAMKALVNNAVTQINQSMVTVQTVIDELKEERESLAIARAVEDDPQFGMIS